MAPFGFFRKEKKPTELQQVDVRLSDLKEWFEGVMEKELSEKRGEAESVHNSIMDRFAGIRSSLETLDKARLMGKERLHISANMIKDSFVKKSYPPLSSIESFARNNFRRDYAYFQAFQDRASSSLKDLKEATPKQTILLTRFFKRESEELVSRIKQADRMVEDFRVFLLGSAGSLDTLKSIADIAGEHASIGRRSQEADSRIGKLEERMASLKEGKSRLEKEYLKLLKSKDWKRINALGKKASELRDAAREAGSALDTELGSVARPLRKLEHNMADSSLSPIQRNALHDFVRNPFKAIMSEKGEKNLQSCLEAVKRLIEKGKMKLDEKEIGKVDELMAKLRKEIPAMKARYERLLEEGEEVREAMGKLSEKETSKGRLEAEIRKSADELGRLGEEVRNLQASKATLARDFTERVRELEIRLLEQTQKKVNIRV